VETLPNGQQIWQGFERLTEILAATGKRQQQNSLTAFSAQEIKDLGQGRLPAEAAKAATSPGRALTAISDAWQRWQMRGNAREIATILTDPASANMLRAIRSAPQGSNAALMMSARLLGQGTIAAEH
jgi:hypothetical protein